MSNVDNSKLTKYLISIEVPMFDHWEGVAYASKLLSQCGVKYQHHEWASGESANGKYFHNFKVDCNDHTLMLIIIAGGEVRKNLSDMYKQRALTKAQNFLASLDSEEAKALDLDAIRKQLSENLV